MLSGIRKQRDILLSLNDEIEEELYNLKSISEQMKESEKTRAECNEMIKNYHLEMPRVRKDFKLFTTVNKKKIESKLVFLYKVNI